VPGPKVILVDDNPEFLDRVRILLTDGFNVMDSFEDGVSLLTSWDELEPDVVVLDISMSPLGGIDLARKLTEQGYAGPIVFLTMHRDPDFVRAALAAGAAAYVLKSHVVSDLVPALHAALSGERFLSASLRP
jgi:DNA-binding NarL/FixJ family response regulator